MINQPITESSITGCLEYSQAELAQLRYITMSIEPYQSEHLDTVIQLSFKAWAPVFDSL